MRRMVTLGVAVAALAAAALAGAGTASATKLCKVVPSGSPLTCPFGEGYFGKNFETTLEPGTKAKFKRLAGGQAGEVTCDESKITGTLMENGEAAPSGGIKTALFDDQAKGSCASTFFMSPRVELTLLNLPYDETKAIYLGTAAPQGEVKIAESVEVKMRVLTMPEVICTFTPKNNLLKAELINGSTMVNSKVKFNGSLFVGGGGGLCPTEGEFNATYEIARTNPVGRLYIAN